MALFVRATNKCSFINNYSNRLTVINTEFHKWFGFSKDCLLLRCRRNNTQNVATFSGHAQSSTPAKTIQKNALDKREASFEKFLLLRRMEAKRSVVVQVQSVDSYSDLYSYCSGFGRINSIQYYVVAKTSCFFLIEFQETPSKTALLKSATHLQHNEIIPVQSQMLWFRNLTGKKRKSPGINMPKLVKAIDSPSIENMFCTLASHNSISEQMESLHKMLELDDIGIRLRFLTADQMESSFSSLFPNLTVLPFGSSVNGFGKKGCDLDLVLNFEPNRSEKANSRLVFHTKSALPHERAQTQRSMETLASVLQFFVPGVMNVQRILNARVPIIKFDHKLTGLECDLSMTNMTAIYMSELLYLYGENNPNVRPLIFTIRQWAAALNITNTNPGGWITNFSLSILVLFFLQCQKILPSVNSLKNSATTSDVRLTDECIDCTFIRDVSMWPVVVNSSGPESLENLLAGFYHFYANFDFATKAISLRDGFSVYKPDTAPLYICNPLEKTLNVSKNVSNNELMRFVDAVRKASMIIDKKNNAGSRGLLDIFSVNTVHPTNKNVGKHTGNKVCIADLFESKAVPEDEVQRTAGNKKESARRR